MPNAKPRRAWNHSYRNVAQGSHMTEVSLLQHTYEALTHRHGIQKAECDNEVPSLRDKGRPDERSRPTRQPEQLEVGRVIREEREHRREQPSGHQQHAVHQCRGQRHCAFVGREHLLHPVRVQHAHAVRQAPRGELHHGGGGEKGPCPPAPVDGRQGGEDLGVGVGKRRQSLCGWVGGECRAALDVEHGRERREWLGFTVRDDIGLERRAYPPEVRYVHGFRFRDAVAGLAARDSAKMNVGAHLAS